VTAYGQQDSCGVYHAVQYSNLCHMLTWESEEEIAFAVLRQRDCNVGLCCILKASVKGPILPKLNCAV
jgi:hypothetical protein